MRKEVYSVLLEEEFRKEFLNKSISKFKTQINLAKYLNSKIKKRKIIRENIKDWLKGKHKNGWDILIPIDVLEELSKVNNIKLDNVLKNAIKFNPPWINPNKKKYLIDKKKTIKIKAKGGKEYLDLYSILPPTTLKSKRSGKKLPLYAKIYRGVIELWSEANWKRSSIKLKRFVELNDLFFIGSSIYASEGTTKVGNDNTSISIGNSEPAIINLFFEWIDSFLINYKMNVKIEFNGEVCSNANLISFWKRKVINIRDSQIPIRIRANLGSRLIRNRGILNIKISNTILKSFVIKLICISKKLALSNEEYSLAYLRGLLASEGSITRPKLKDVSIGCTNKEEREFIGDLLKKLNLRHTEGINQFSITNWSSFYYLYKHDIFNIPQINNISKKRSFISGFKEHQTSEGFIKLKRFANEKFTANDWQKRFNLKYYISAHKFLKKFVENEILLTEFKKNIKYYYINPKKADFLENVWKINGL